MAPWVERVLGVTVNSFWLESGQPHGPVGDLGIPTEDPFCYLELGHMSQGRM